MAVIDEDAILIKFVDIGQGTLKFI
ncbi:hypothetical protein ABNG30_20880 [Bacillus thuringiensis]